MSRFTPHRSWIVQSAMVAGITALGVTGSAAHASLLATDNAGNYQGSGGTTNVWTNSSNPSPLSPTEPNGGTGFGAWTISNQQSATPPYNGSGLTTFNTSNPINTNGNFWYMYANGGSATARTDAYRAFTGSLSAGQSFSVALQTQGVGASAANGLPSLGFSLDSGSGPSLTAGSVSVTSAGTGPTSATNYVDANALFSLSFNELGPAGNTNSNLTGYNGVSNTSSSGYVVEVNIAAGGTTTSSLLSAVTSPAGANSSSYPAGSGEFELNAGLSANFTLGAGNSYTLTLTPVGSTTEIQKYSGTLGAGSINGADIFDQSTYQNGNFNSLAITAVPEPATIGLFIAAGAGLLLVRRRRTA
jgi:hypothetical protein